MKPWTDFGFHLEEHLPYWLYLRWGVWLVTGSNIPPFSLHKPVLLSFIGDGRHLWGGCCGRPCPSLSSEDQLTSITQPSLSRTTLMHTTPRKELNSSTSLLQLWYTDGCAPSSTNTKIFTSAHMYSKTKSALLLTDLVFQYTSTIICCLALSCKISPAFSFFENSRAARAERTEAEARHLMPSSWHQGPLKDSSGLWNQPAVHRVQRFNKFQGSSQGRVTLWTATQNQKPSKYLRMVIIDSLNRDHTCSFEYFWKKCM